LGGAVLGGLSSVVKGPAFSRSLHLRSGLIDHAGTLIGFDRNADRHAPESVIGFDRNR
jgi:hypothetical protein